MRSAKGCKVCEFDLATYFKGDRGHVIKSSLQPGKCVFRKRKLNHESVLQYMAPTSVPVANRLEERSHIVTQTRRRRCLPD